ncbi:MULTISPECIES: hypothetical protein [unclassified Microcoleus]|uniref:hypothetical protein n=1 Tax=unclassified Microcoleus TaxID=2642155 RepID=UPI001D8A51A0|nr:MULTISPECIES: hypothetical protein [unclassified Microcoleus]MCC3503032.1 hypothetical protein [Microcoleus sp. PH2017_19_SFW_U_A]TAE15484.1 MAG: hypothetical protein EAZ94_04300 [Oscillatoriales cyanobacterium]MCC3410563.1 hypothetical protein [Microcoleus sp. PH2017_02_FOX_O_A]MCC3489248.1 hypothetical protein [Microcoleus sp. PH2017_16_JOR_D_A]MCC3515976.1 hypothetical protein [Microcoleus sp. PH2017_18_LLB_O_A]
MTITTVDRPARITEMGRAEADSITQDIKGNFDSLGSMLIEARDRKAYKALGYRTFESYCKTEFGKSSSSAYRLIEDAKVVARLEAEIAKQYDEPITLNIPSACLRPLKEIPDIGNKLKAIEYAKNLAAAEGKKATKKHLEIAVFEISGKRSQDYKAAIQSLGFTKGVPVEIVETKDVKSDRGLVKKVDKLGKIHVALYSGGVYPKPLGASDLRILTKAEKPTTPLNEITASKGDRVLIFAKGLEGKKGIIHKWKDECQALVTVDGEDELFTIAYAEMELIRREQEEANWESELVWEAGKNRYYYFPQEDTIYSDTWPQGLALKPHSHEQSPTEFMREWEDKFAGDLLESLTNPARLKTLALAQAIELPEDEGKEFAADLIASLNQLFPQASKPKAMGISFALTINELTSGKKTQTRRAWQDDYAKNFIRYFDKNIAIPALNKGRHRGGYELGFIKLTQRPYQQYLSEMSPIDLQEEGGMVATAQEFIDTYFEGQDKLVWVLHFEFLSTPAGGNTSLLTEENQRLREQLAEAELTIQTMRNVEAAFLADTAAHTKFLVENAASTDSVADTAAHTEFLVENAASTDSVSDTATHTEFLVENTTDNLAPGDTADADWKSILTSNNFTPNYHYTDNCTEEYRGWKIYLDPNGGFSYVDLNHPEKGAFCCDTHSLNIESENEDEIIKWAKEVINQVETFCPGQLSLDLNLEVESFPQALLIAISAEEEKIYNIIDRKEYQHHSAKLTKREIAAITKNNLQRLRNSLQELIDFRDLRIGQLVTKRFHPESKGTITGFELSAGGMPLVWVNWFRDEGEEKRSTEHYPLKSLIVES